MIYVRRDPALIPEKILKVAERAQSELEELPAHERVAFIKKKSHIWRAFGRHLAKMSYGKCWYSESPDPQSFFDVDHFRPKSAARRSETVVDDGYPWLAFSWENFRYSAGRSNRPNTNEDTDAAAGKGSWFPLLENSALATWEDRCVDEEKPLLLDPVVRADVDLLKVDVVGKVGFICGSDTCIGPVRRARVSKTIEVYGLNLPHLVTARIRTMREINDLYEILLNTLAAVATSDGAADKLAIEKHIEYLRAKTRSDAPYSRAARAQLFCLGGGDLCAQPEDIPQAA